MVLGWIGAGLTLPYYGAEVFGLHAIAAQAVQDGSPALLELTDVVRYQPAAVTMFGLGLVLLAAAVALVAVVLGRSRLRPRWVGVPLAVGFVLFIPQFFASPALRILHGALVAVGAIMVAVVLWRAPST